MIGELYAGALSIPYTASNINPLEVITWNIDFKILSVHLLLGLPLLSLDKRDDFANKNEAFYNNTIVKVLAAINDIRHQIFNEGVQARDFFIHPVLKEYFLERALKSNMGRFFNPQNLR